jgi:hypothetical protein
MSSSEEEVETQFGVQRWVEPYSTDEIWSNVLDPIGAAFGCRQTCVDYTFFKILKTLWEVGLSVRLVMLHFDEDEELPQSQITYLRMQQFLNVEVKITLVKETFVEGQAFDGGIYRWDKNSFKLLRAPPVHLTFVNHVLGGDTPGVFHSDFTITVNQDCFLDEKKVRQLILANQKKKEEEIPTEAAGKKQSVKKRERSDEPTLPKTSEDEEERKRRRTGEEGPYNDEEAATVYVLHFNDLGDTIIATGTQADMLVKQKQMVEKTKTFLTPWGEYRRLHNYDRWMKPSELTISATPKPHFANVEKKNKRLPQKP